MLLRAAGRASRSPATWASRQTLRGAGIAGSKTVYELFASPGGAWTILLTTVEGKSCAIYHGRGGLRPDLTGLGA